MVLLWIDFPPVRSDRFLEHQLQKNSDNFDLNKYFSKCIFKGTPTRELSEYQMVCQCRGENLLLDYAPYLVSGSVIDEVGQLLSNKTIDSLGGFMDDNLGLPPEIKDILKDKPVFVL